MYRNNISRHGAARNRALALLTMFVLLAFTRPAAAGNIAILLNGAQRNYNPAPQIINDRVLVPMRAIFEDLGAEVSWDGSSRTAMAVKDGRYVSVQIGSRTGTSADAVLVNGESQLGNIPSVRMAKGEYQLSNIQSISLEAAPIIVKNSTMLPLRFVSESLGARVEWVGASQQVLISANTDPVNAAASGYMVTPVTPNPLDSSTTPANPATTVTPVLNTPVASSTEMRGVWLSFDNLANFNTTQIDSYLDATTAMGMNTVFVHARAFSDSFYKSALFPWSHKLCGVQGQAPALDPLQYVVSQGHKRGLRVEAWINPYRISTTTELSNALAPNNPAVKWLNDPSKVLHYQVNGQECLIYNPGSPEVRDLITAGITEIIDNYAVDGIHFDDYFYVSGVKEAYTTEFKENEVNKLIRQVYTAVKAKNASLTFGVSPAGNIANCNAAGADVQTWLSQAGYVDYVCPQIYWTNQYTNAKYQFNNCLNDWIALKKSPQVKLYAGLALYRVGVTSTSDPGWANNSDNMASQVRQVRGSGQCSGFILFKVSDLLSPAAQSELQNLKVLLR